MTDTHRIPLGIFCALLLLSLISSFVFPPVSTVSATTDTFYSEAALDGEIQRYDDTYPPTEGSSVYASATIMAAGQKYDGNYMQYRMYVSFDTSSIPDSAVITNAYVYLKTTSSREACDTDFYVKCYGGSQPIYGSSLDTGDWGKGTSFRWSWATVNWQPNDWIPFSVGSNINKQGRTQFEFKSSREGTAPTGEEYLDFYTANSAYDPYLQVTYTTNSAPTNGPGAITDMDDGDNLYAQKRWYTGSSSATDTNGYADINYMEFRIKQGANTRAIFRYDEDTNTFSIVSGDAAWELDVAGSSAEKSGNLITCTWKFKPKFGAIEEGSLEIELYVCDDEPTSDTDTAQTDYLDVVTTLTIINFASSPSEYINPSTSATFSGAVRYVGDPGSGGSSSSYPPNAEFTAIHVHDASHSSKGSDTSIVNGGFSVSFSSDPTVGQDTYHPYIDMVDADYTDGDVSGIADTLTVEQVKVISYSVPDPRVNVNDNVDIDVTLQFATDSTLVTGGTATINGYSATHQGSGVWRITRTSASVAGVTYNTVAASGNARGITSVNQNGQSKLVVWDRVHAAATLASDNHANIGDNVNIDWTLKYDYDETPLTDGSVLIEGISASHQGSGVWRITQSKATVQSALYDEFTVSGNTHGITAVDTEGHSETVIWDRVIVSIQANSTNPSVGEAIQSSITAIYEYNSVQVTSWSINILRNETHFAEGNFTDSHAGEVVYQYTTENIAENTYGLTVFSTNTLTVSWGGLQIEAYEILVDNTRIDIQTGTYLRYHLRFSGNQSDVPSGILYVNTTGHSISSGWANFSVLQSSVGKWKYVITGVNVNGETDYSQIPSDPEVVWDQVHCVATGKSDGHTDVYDNVNIDFTLKYDYDETLVIDGNVMIEGFSASYQGGGIWRITRTSSIVASVLFKEFTVAGNTHGITAVSMDGQGGETVIWDKVNVTIEANATVPSAGDTVEFTVSGVYAFSSDPVNDWTVNILRNQSWFATGDFIDCHETLALYEFTTENVTEYLYGLTGFSTNVEIVSWLPDSETIGPFVVTSTYPMGDNGTWDDSFLELIFWSRGTIIVAVGSFGAPEGIEIAGMVWTDWTYDEPEVTINNVASKVLLYWKTAAAGPTGGPSWPPPDTGDIGAGVVEAVSGIPWPVPLGVAGFVGGYMVIAVVRKPKGFMGQKKTKKANKSQFKKKRKRATKKDFKS